MSRSSLTRLVLLLAALLGVPAWAADTRIALLITNQAYRQPGAALTNTHRDGEILKAALEKVGFNVWVAKDTANEGALLKAIGEHVQRLSAAGPDAVGFFYYSGHGAADRPNGENYLIPTDVPLTHASELPLMAVRLERIMSTLTAAGRMSFVVFDACRNVPLQRADKSPFKGFAPVREQNGLLIAFATEPGNVAIDQNLYAKSLAEELVVPGLEAAQVFRRVRLRVREGTQQAQSPEYTDRRDNDFHFASAPATSVAVAQPPAAKVAPAPGVALGARQSSDARAPLPLKAAEEHALRPTDSFKECGTCPEMVVMPTGKFTMGSPTNEGGRSNAEGPQHGVTLERPFAVGKYEVTFAEWEACATGGGCAGNKSPSDSGWGKGRRPVINVSWDDAKEYVAWLSRTTGKAYRLLSEAEWEYAARAGTSTTYAWGNEIGTNRANCAGCGSQWDKQIAPVGSFTANAFGLHDMHGNVWEWVEDCWHDSYQGAPTDGSVWAISCTDSVRVLRGGFSVNGPLAIRAASRIRGAVDGRANGVGFRVGRTL